MRIDIIGIFLGAFCGGIFMFGVPLICGMGISFIFFGEFLMPTELLMNVSRILICVGIIVGGILGNFLE